MALIFGKTNKKYSMEELLKEDLEEWRSLPQPTPEEEFEQWKEEKK